MRILTEANSDFAMLRPTGALRCYNVPERQVAKALKWSGRHPALVRQSKEIVQTAPMIPDLTEEEAANVAASVNVILDAKLPPGPSPNGLFRECALFSKNEFEGDPIDPVYGRTLSAMVCSTSAFTLGSVFEFMDCLSLKHPLWRLHVLVGGEEVDLALMIYPDCVRIDRDIYLRAEPKLESQLNRWAAAVDLFRAMIRLKNA